PLASVHCHRRTSRWRLYQFPRAIENYSARTAILRSAAPLHPAPGCVGRNGDQPRSYRYCRITLIGPRQVLRQPPGDAAVALGSDSGLLDDRAVPASYCLRRSQNPISQEATYGPRGASVRDGGLSATILQARSLGTLRLGGSNRKSLKEKMAYLFPAAVDRSASPDQFRITLSWCGAEPSSRRIMRNRLPSTEGW